MQTTNSIDSQKIKIALKKAIGAINKGLDLLENQDYAQCSDVLVQIDSAIGSLNSSRSQVIDKFLDTCIDENIQIKDRAKFKAQITKLYKLNK
jgi:DNA-binding FrmR family transcriptional regulator